jgi:acetoin utilization deacetylase AcuC-like enzyme
VDLVMSGDGPVFCAVRPPGHHAERARAMGFCVFDNVAIGALHALEVHGLERVAVIDFDVHHGNGTQDILGRDPRVLFCSSFQHPFYPWGGLEDATETCVPIPLKAGTDGPAFRAAVEAAWWPALDAFRPQLILLSAGFDAHLLDDMSSVCLTEADYAWLTEGVMDLARRHAGGRVVSVLEGGYEPGALARSVVAHLKAML